jgi:hypothetical protein
VENEEAIALVARTCNCGFELSLIVDRGGRSEMKRAGSGFAARFSSWRRRLEGRFFLHSFGVRGRSKFRMGIAIAGVHICHGKLTSSSSFCNNGSVALRGLFWILHAVCSNRSDFFQRDSG